MRRRRNIFGLSKSQRKMFKLLVILIVLIAGIKALELAVEYWPVVALLFIVFIFFKQASRSTYKKKFSLSEVDELSPRGFEEYLGEFFMGKGYSVIVTPLSGDKGADLIVEKNGIRTAIQAKHYKGRVDHRSVQEVYCSLNYYKCKKAIVITNSHFTKTAKELSGSNNVELWDRERLRNELSRINMVDSMNHLLKQPGAVCGKNQIR